MGHHAAFTSAWELLIVFTMESFSEGNLLEEKIARNLPRKFAEISCLGATIHLSQP